MRATEFVYRNRQYWDHLEELELELTADDRNTTLGTFEELVTILQKVQDGSNKG